MAYKPETEIAIEIKIIAIDSHVSEEHTEQIWLESVYR